GFGELRVRVPERGHGDPRQKVEVDLALLVADLGAVAVDEDLLGAAVRQKDVLVHASSRAVTKWVNRVPTPGSRAERTTLGPDAGAIFRGASGFAATAARAASTFGIIPPRITPLSRSSAQCSVESTGITRPSASSTPGTSVRKRSARAWIARAS